LGDTKDVSGIASYSLDATATQIKADLVKRFNEAQTALNNNISLVYYGITWDGAVWSA
jgi:phage regulator Rha-like protein